MWTWGRPSPCGGPALGWGALSSFLLVLFLTVVIAAQAPESFSRQLCQLQPKPALRAGLSFCLISPGNGGLTACFAQWTHSQ